MAFQEQEYFKVPLDDHNNDARFDSEHSSVGSPKLSTSGHAKYIIFHACLIFIYGILTLIIVRSANVKVSLREKASSSLTYSPAQTAIRKEKYVFNAAPNLTSPFVGESRMSLDKAWHELLSNTNLRISQEDLDKLDRTSIPLGVGGGYYGELAVFHELHCLKFIRQAFHMEYYGKLFGEREKETMGEHTEHCIEILRQSVMCRGDTTLITFKWGHTVKLPQPDFSLEHECVNWDSLMDWASQHSINVFEKGMLVHPTLGPAYPGGHREDRPAVADLPV